MKRTVIVASICALLISCSSSARTDLATEPSTNEELEVRATVIALYNVLSGPAGRRDWNRFAALFAPGGVIVTAPVADGKQTTMTPKEFETAAMPRLNETGSFEWPVAIHIQRYGDIAQAWSVYEERRASNDAKRAGRGLSAFQLVRIGDEWKVQSVLMQLEDPAHPIPAHFLSAR
jgi:hypothetical protein